MNFDDQDWELEERASRPRDTSTDVWKVAAGVAVGILIGGALVWAAGHHEAWQDARPALVEPEPGRAAVEVTPGAAPVELLRLPAEPTAAGTPALIKPSVASTTEPAPAMIQRAAPQKSNAETDAAKALRGAQQAAERKERAWALFYKKPAACDDSPPKASLVECANHFIRAKREFEQVYGAGRPAPARQAGSASSSASGA